MNPVEARVLAALRAGPSTIDDLRLSLGYPRRDVEAAVEALRLAGEPILGENTGLRLTENAEELARYVDQRRRRTVAIYLGSRALRRSLRRMRERDDLTFWGAA